MTATLLRGGTVFDGVSPQRQQASVLVANGVIQRVGVDIPSTEATTVIDIDGAWLTPGFIDPHSHADAAVITGEQMENRAHSGVTTEIVGQDGLALSHAQGRAADQMTEILTPVAGDVSGLLCDGVAEYLTLIDRGAYARVATLSPHGTLRAKVIGRDLRPATSDELDTMVRAFTQDMADGALGLSTGLSYPPALASNTHEIATLLAAAGPNTPYVTHLRSYGQDFDAALDEAIDIAQLSGCHLHLSHFHVSGPGRLNQAADYLALLAALPATPTLDSYPYRHACTFLTALLPSRLQDLSYRELQDVIQREGALVVEEITAAGPEATIAVGWRDLIVAGLSGEQASWNGLSLNDIGTTIGYTPEEVIAHLIVREGHSPMVLVPQGHNANIRAIAASSLQVVGSDGIFGSGAPHPRLTGTFFRFLRAVLDGDVAISVEEAVAKMTSRTAAIFGINSGVVAAGYPADLLVIDPVRIDAGDDVTVSRPASIQHAFIGGKQTIKDGVWQGKTLSQMAMRGMR